MSNQDNYDNLIRHQIFLERYKNGAVKRISAFLRELDIELASAIEARLRNMSAKDMARIANGTAWETQRLQSLRQFLRDMEKAAAKELADRTIKEVTPIGESQAARLVQSAKTTVGLALTLPTTARIERLTRMQPFDGSPLGEWASDWSESRRKRVTRELRMALASGESPTVAARRLRGTKASGYTNGALGISRRGAETLVRTAARHASIMASDEFTRRNLEHIEKVVWVSVLDTRTSGICRANDGREFEPGTQVGIPAHANCRSNFVNIYKDQGTIPRDEPFGSWIDRQSEEIQRESLGDTRARLMQDGGLQYKDLVNKATNQEYTLAELRKIEGEAFDKIK